MDGYQNIPALLHDAHLNGLDWEPHLNSMWLSFACLRRSVDGAPIMSPTVELYLEGLNQVAAYYSPANIEVRPSEFSVPDPLSSADLQQWTRPPDEAFVAINSPHADFEMATSCAIEWLFGEPLASGSEDSHLRMHLTFRHSYEEGAVAIALFFACDSIQPFSAGVPLSIDDWGQQFGAWWQNWKEHWSAKGSADEESESEVVIEDKFIPAGEDPPPDLSYRPPAEPAFQLTATDAPNELLQPIEDFHVGLHKQEWARMASAYPDFNQSQDQRANQLRDQNLRHEFGRWVYVRQIDSWWCEGRRACVVVRGIEHTMPHDEDLARNEETEITYGLRKCEDRWIIWTWSQGWPRHRPGVPTESSQSWRKGWNLSE